MPMQGGSLNPDGTGLNILLNVPEGSMPEPLIPLFPESHIPAPKLFSPLRLTANAVILFRPQSSVVLVEDPYTGNVTQISETAEPIRVYAAVREVKRSLREEKTSGMATNQIPLRGYILSPSVDVRTFDLSDQVEIELIDTTIGSITKGLMNMTITANPHAERIRQVSGIPFTGILSRVGSGETPE